MKASSYWTASSFSFVGHKDRFSLSLNGDVQEIPLGFQPYGISSRPLPGERDLVIVADYFAPAFCLFEVRVAGSDLHFEQVRWIHGAQNGISRCRGGFPDMLYPMGANRGMAVCFDPDDGGSVWVNRGEREFFVLMERAGAVTAQERSANATWEVTRKVGLPRNDAYPFVFSAAWVAGELRTIEAPSNLGTDDWQTVAYEYHDDGLRVVLGTSCPPWTRGVAMAGGDRVTITDVERPEADRGVYRDSLRLIPNVWGSGLCPLSNGGVLVSRYGQEAGGPFKGIPGALLYLPPTLFSGIKWTR